VQEDHVTGPETGQAGDDLVGSNGGPPVTGIDSPQPRLDPGGTHGNRARDVDVALRRPEQRDRPPCCLLDVHPSTPVLKHQRPQ